MMRENLISVKEARRDQLDGESFTGNGACVKMDQCSLQLICSMRELKLFPIWGDFRGATVPPMPLLPTGAMT
jgi:hypothetical protein